MAYLSTDIPPIQCWMRAEFLYNLESHQGKFVRVVIFGVSSIPGQAILFHCLTDSGAQIARMPISAFVHKKNAPILPLDHLELWDAYSYDVSVHAFQWLKSMSCSVFLKDGAVYKGTYLFTVDWAGSSTAESAGDIGHKNAHIIKLKNGCFAAQPNNRIIWHEPSSIKQGLAKRPRYVTNSYTWHAEIGTASITPPLRTLRRRPEFLQQAEAAGPK